jgi:hypothetical protein
MLTITPKAFPQPNLEVVTIVKLDVLIEILKNTSLEDFDGNIVIHYIDDKGTANGSSRVSVKDLALKFAQMGETPENATIQAVQTFLGLITLSKPERLAILQQLGMAYEYEILGFEN